MHYRRVEAVLGVAAKEGQERVGHAFAERLEVVSPLEHEDHTAVWSNAALQRKTLGDAKPGRSHGSLTAQVIRQPLDGGSQPVVRRCPVLEPCEGICTWATAIA